jgi:thiosulfate/3-mercaptopyruvate sulfurtransferase
MTRRILLSCMVIPALIAAGCDRSPTEPTLTPNPDLLVSTEWLASRLQDPAVVVVHVGTQANFNAGHIPGARFVNLGSLQGTRDGVPFMLNDVAVLREAFEAAGVAGTSHVVVYGDGPLQAARGFFVLDYLGHPRVSLLDGGKAVWAAESRPMSATASPVTRGSWTPAPRADRLVTAAWIRDRLQDTRTVLIDARPTADYAGEVAPTAQLPRPGHIPGASNVPWSQLVVSTEMPKLRARAELETLLGATGARPGVAVVTYCTSGMMSSVAYFAARYLGHDVKLYDGSWFDWSPREEFPVARCSTPNC